MKTIGILGGMGPGASLALYQKIIRYSQTRYRAVQDTDYPPIVLYSLPLVGFDETGIVDHELVKDQLIHGVKTLERSGADFIIIACNTVHLFIAEMRHKVSIPIFSIIEESLSLVQNQGLSKVGLVSSQTTRDLGIYFNIFSGNHTHVLQVSNSNQQRLNKVIESVMGGKQSSRETVVLKKIIEDLAHNGAEAVILGCTELPLVIHQSDTTIKIVDTLELIARNSVDYANPQLPLSEI